MAEAEVLAREKAQILVKKKVRAKLAVKGVKLSDEEVEQLEEELIQDLEETLEEEEAARQKMQIEKGKTCYYLVSQQVLNGKISNFAKLEFSIFLLKSSSN